MYKRINEYLGTDYNSDENIEWGHITTNYKLSNEFLFEFKNSIDWEYVSCNQKLEKETIKYFSKYLDWNSISMFQELDLELLTEFADNLDWDYIVKYHILNSEDIYYNLKDYLTNVSEKNLLIEQPFIIPENHNKNLLNRYLGKNIMYHLYQETKEKGWFFGYVEKDIIETYKDKLYFYCIEKNKTMMNRLKWCSVYKSRIYWKDVKLKNWISNYEPFRKIKLF